MVEVKYHSKGVQGGCFMSEVVYRRHSKHIANEVASHLCFDDIRHLQANELTVADKQTSNVTVRIFVADKPIKELK